MFDDDADELSEDELEEINKAMAEREAVYQDFQTHMQQSFGNTAVLSKNSPAYRGLITRAVAVVEVQGDDGESYIVTVEPPDGAPWRTIGMLETVTSLIKMEGF